MKGKLLILFVLLTIQQAYSQIGSGDILIGGSLQIQSSEDFRQSTILPNVQYLFSDNISFGGAVGFQTIRDARDYPDDIYDRENMIYIRPEARYYIELSETVNFYTAGVLGLGFGGGTNIDNTDGRTKTNLYDRSEFSININPGIIFTPGSSLGFTAELDLISFRRQGFTPDGSNNTSEITNFTFGLNTFAPRFGIYYVLGN